MKKFKQLLGLLNGEEDFMWFRGLGGVRGVGRPCELRHGTLLPVNRQTD